MISLFIVSCNNNKSSAATDDSAGNANNTTRSSEDKKAADRKEYDPKRGEGKFTKVDPGASLDGAKATSGEKVYEIKCSGCHKLTNEKLVGPGWLGVTSTANFWILGAY